MIELTLTFSASAFKWNSKNIEFIFFLMLVYFERKGFTFYRAVFCLFLFFTWTVWLTSPLIKSYPNPAGKKGVQGCGWAGVTAWWNVIWTWKINKSLNIKAKNFTDGSPPTSALVKIKSERNAQSGRKLWASPPPNRRGWMPACHAGWTCITKLSETLFIDSMSALFPTFTPYLLY